MLMSDSKSPSERFYQTGVLFSDTPTFHYGVVLDNVARWYSGNQGRHRAFVWGLPRLSGGMSTCLNKPMPKRKTICSTLHMLAVNKTGIVARLGQRLTSPTINRGRVFATSYL